MTLYIYIKNFIAPEPTESKPPVPMEESSCAEVPKATPSTSSAIEVDQETLNLLKKRQQEYRIAAVAWKKAGNTEEAIQHVKLVKQFDSVIAAISAGNVVDLADMPGSPKMPETTMPVLSTSEREENESQQATPAEEEEAPRKIYDCRFNYSLSIESLLNSFQNYSE